MICILYREKIMINNEWFIPLKFSSKILLPAPSNDTNLRFIWSKCGDSFDYKWCDSFGHENCTDQLMSIKYIFQWISKQWRWCEKDDILSNEKYVELSESRIGLSNLEISQIEIWFWLHYKMKLIYDNAKHWQIGWRIEWLR